MATYTDGLTPTQMADLIIAADAARPGAEKKPGFAYLQKATAPRRFELMNHAFPDHKLMVRGGEYIDDYVIYKENGTASYVLPGQLQTISSENVLLKLRMGWAHANAFWMIINEEVLACRGKQQIIDLVLARRVATQMDMAIMVEEQMWAAGDATSAVLPFTIPSHLPPITGYQVTDSGSFGMDLTGAFQATYASGFSDYLGADTGAHTATVGWSSETYKRLRSYNAVASNSAGEFTDTDEDRLGKMMDYLGFDVPFLVDIPKSANEQQQRLYVNYTSKQSMERKAKQQNDQVGSDLARYQGGTLFRGLEPIWQIQLDTASATARGTFPIYLINWAHGQPIVREGKFFRAQTFPAIAQQHDVTTTHLDLDYNFRVANRQQFGGVLSYVAAA